MSQSDPDRSSPQPPAAPEKPVADLQSQLRFLGLAETDARAVRRILPLIQAGEQRLIDGFYRHLFAFSQTSRFLQDAELVTRLKESQRNHLRSMLAANWNDAYAEERRRVGDTHADVGIEPQYFLGAYCQYLQFCFQEIAESHQGTRQDLAETLLALVKVVMLDTGLTLDAYFAHSTQSLRSALDMLWKANTELRQFAHLTSHDLKTPLATVANLCDEALDEFGEQIPEAARGLIEAARQRTFRMSAMINELLADITISETDGQNETIDTASLFEEVFERVRAEAHRKQIEMTIESTLPSVWGNRVRLREAFYNLIANAVKFIDKRPGAIRVNAQTSDGHILFTVEDNGPGIPADELDRIFSPFRRLQQDRDKAGSGLGLYFTKNLIERQGGRVWAESQPGEGSRFCVLVPRHPHG